MSNEYNRLATALCLIMDLIMLSSCSSTKSGGIQGADPDAVKQASIMTNKCMLNYHDIPGSLTQRQDCMNLASQSLMASYPAEIQAIAKTCAQKLSQLAATTDAGNLSIGDYQQHREALKLECAQAAQAAIKR